MDNQDIVYLLRKRAEIRRQAHGRKSVLEGKPDRISDLLERAAVEIETLRALLRPEPDPAVGFEKVECETCGALMRLPIGCDVTECSYCLGA